MTEPSIPPRERAKRNRHPARGNGTGDRTIAILGLFTDERPIWTINEIAQHVGMPRSTVYRYIATLRSAGLVMEAGHCEGLKLGPGVFALFRAARAGNSVIQLATPYMWRLIQTFKGNVGLQERIGSDLVILDILTSASSPIIRPRQVLPWPVTCPAQVLFAFAPAEERAALMAQTTPVRYSDRTPSNRDELAKLLAQIRLRGYAVQAGEHDPDTWVVGAPVFSYGEARYCLALAVPHAQSAHDQAATMIAAVTVAARQLSVELARTEY